MSEATIHGSAFRMVDHSAAKSVPRKARYKNRPASPKLMIVRRRVLDFTAVAWRQRRSTISVPAGAEKLKVASDTFVLRRVDSIAYVVSVSF